MYCEKIVNGVLCFRNSPNQGWTEMPAQEITEKLEAAKAFQNEKEGALNLISNIDWRLLRLQKQALLSIMPEGTSLVDGILNMIDAIQDFAVDVLDQDPNDVFNTEE